MLMNDELMMQVFFEIHSELPREGPGSFESTKKAFSMLSELPSQPLILDIGCGPGMQTLDLCELMNGNIVAIDNHEPFLKQLAEKARQRDVANRITIVNADMAALDFKTCAFDLIWAEGSAYITGFENALRMWKPLLKSRGYLAATEVSWINTDPSEELLSFWAEEYPAIRDIDSNLAIVCDAGYDVIGQFVLPESDWWDHYYRPIEPKLFALRDKYKENPEALAVIDLHEREINLYRRYSYYYGYVFYVMQVPP